MALGIWVDNSGTWTFQKLIASADLDTMAENDNRILRAGRLLFQDHMGYVHVDLDPGDSYRFDNGNAINNPFSRTLGLFDFSTTPDYAQERWVHFAAYLGDLIPYDTIIMMTYVDTTNDVGGMKLELDRATDPGDFSAGSTSMISTTVNAPGWFYLSADISALAAGPYHFRLHYDMLACSVANLTPVSIYLARAGF